jgi:colanic acid biosynthesis protein WcaH
MTTLRPLPIEEYLHVVRNTPLVSIDLVIKDQKDDTLLGLRLNEPAKGKYFVPGGVIRKNESIAIAFSRIIKAETGIDKLVSEANFIGVFEHIYETNAFGRPDFGTHYVVLAYELRLEQRPLLTSDTQHCDFRWMSASEIRSTLDVHPYTQAYFR